MRLLNRPRLIVAPGAITMRGYNYGVRAVFGVRDDFCPWNDGAFELDAGPDGAHCKPTTRSPNVALSLAELAAVYLGGTTLDSLSRAGRVRQLASGTIAGLDRAMATPRLPWTLEF